MRQKDIIEWLKNYKEEDIYYSKHIREDKFKTGKVKESDVRKNLLDPQNLVQFVEQESLNSNEFKYKLRFKLSRSKYIGIVVQLNEKLKVITAYIIEKKWQDKMVWWLWKKK